MVRHAEGDDFLLKYLSSIASDYKCAVGLILGQVTSQKYNIIHFAKTPIFQSEQEKDEKSIKNLKNISDINDSWVADHARQTTRMLPGGMHVLGIFVVCEEEVLSPFNAKLKSIFFYIHKTLSLENYLFGNVSNEKLLIHFSPKTHKCIAKTYDVVSFTVQPTEFRCLQKINKLIIFECTYQIDHVYYLSQNETRGSLRKHMKVILDDINRNLESSIILFDGDLKDIDEQIGNMSKKEKLPRGLSNKIPPDSNEINKPISISIFENCVTENVSNNFEMLSIGGQIRVVGEVTSKLSLNSKATFGDAAQATKEDIMRSLATRMEMHWDSLIEEELSEDLNSVHEPPRRVLINLPESNISISDYLFPGEGPDEAKASLEELLDIKADSTLELLDLEGQADISRYYSDPNAAGPGKPKISDSSKFMYLLGLGAALLILIISISVHFFITG